jgi:cytochrome b
VKKFLKFYGQFLGEELLVPHPTLKLDDHPLLAVHDCLFNLVAATFLIEIHSFVCSLRARKAMVTGGHMMDF